MAASRSVEEVSPLLASLFLFCCVALDEAAVSCVCVLWRVFYFEGIRVSDTRRRRKKGTAPLSRWLKRSINRPNDRWGSIAHKLATFTERSRSLLIATTGLYFFVIRARVDGSFPSIAGASCRPGLPLLLLLLMLLLPQLVIPTVSTLALVKIKWTRKMRHNSVFVLF